MGASRRKPYHYLGDSQTTFMRRNVRWLSDVQVKESIFEKPYQSERAEMHMEMPPLPDFTLPPPPTLPDLPDFPTYNPPDPYVPPDDDPLPPIDLPPEDDPEDPEDPGDPIPDDPVPDGDADDPDDPGNPLPDATLDPIGRGFVFTTRPYCYIDTSGKCNQEGESFIVKAQVQHYSSSIRWGVTISNTELVAVTKLAAKHGYISILVTILAELIETVTVCIFARTDKGGVIPLSNGSTLPDSRFLTIKCGCFEVETCCPPVIALEWDADTSPPTMGRNADETVYVLGGKGPYSWSISGTGFVLLDAVTIDQLNVITTDGVACGSAEIIVTDDCGDSVTGYMRSTFGSWVLIGNKTCLIPGPHDDIAGGRYRRTEGNKHMRVIISAGAGGGSSSCPGGTWECPGDCDCSAGAFCGSSEDPCTECITSFDAIMQAGGWIGSWDCWLKDWCEASDGYVSRACRCNEDIQNYTWEC